MPTLLDEKSPLSERRRPAWQLEFFIRSGTRGECVYQLYGGGGGGGQCVLQSVVEHAAKLTCRFLASFIIKNVFQISIIRIIAIETHPVQTLTCPPPPLNHSLMDDSPSFHQARLNRATSAHPPDRHLVILQATGPGKTNRTNLRRGNHSQNNNRKRRNVLSSPSKSNLFHAYLTI